MLILHQHSVPEEIPRIRLLDYALQVFQTIPSRSNMKKVIKRGALLVDGKPGQNSDWVIEKQLITLVDLENKPPKPLDIKLDIVFEDEHLAVINKPAGIEVSGNKYYTIQNALVSNISPSSESDALSWSRPVHRLDMPTSGLLLVAKTASAIMNLGQQFENRKVKKKYHAIVAGNIPDSGEINSKIDDHEALTSFNCIDRCHSLKTQWLSLVELSPHTGRTHQLRIHLAEIGYAIVGDKKYGKGPLLAGKGLFLAAIELSFLHPYKNTPMNISINHPKKFDNLFEREERRWKEYADLNKLKDI